jgi:hypothetical protein
MKRGLSGLTSMAAVAALAVCCPGVAGAATDGSSAARAWTIQAVPLPAKAIDGGLGPISCVSVGDCTALGNYYQPGRKGNQPLAEHWNGTKWSIRALPQPPNAYFVELVAVSCASATSCTAVGHYSLHKDGRGALPLAEYWNGSTWTILATPIGGGLPFGVSCTSPTSCIAVGDYFPPKSQTQVPLAEYWNGSTWTILATPSPSGGSTDELGGVSCTSPTSCTAVGDYFDDTSHANQPLSEYWNGSTWTIAATPIPSGSNGGDLSSVSCTSAASCTAVGNSHYGSGSDQTLQTLAEYWNGSTWTIQATPSPSGPRSSGLEGVSCPSATSCTAVGNSDNNNNGNLAALAEHWNGTKWATLKTAEPTSGKVLFAITCVWARTCTAVGDSGPADGALPIYPLAEHE